jgi:hypothetical protein
MFPSAQKSGPDWLTFSLPDFGEGLPSPKTGRESKDQDCGGVKPDAL